MTHACPICATPCTEKIGDSPYWRCPSCSCWFQDPMPPKVYIGEHEHPGTMSDHEKAVNDDLAGRLFDTVMRGNPGRTLDIGAQYPYLASRLKARGCDAWAVDGDPAIIDASDMLDVVAIRGDFERDEIGQNHDLITLIHSFEHLYNPLAALAKLRRIVAPDGRVFIRMPDHSVSGYERDLVPTHYKIHPFYHSFSSLLEALVQTCNTFEVEDYSPMHGYGQADVTLRPLAKWPTLVVGVIARNEERDLPAALESVEDVGEGVIVIDTGSTDNTVAVAERMGAAVREYTGASELVNGNWRLLDFSNARNQSIIDAENIGADWFMWLDADDRLKSPEVVRRLLYWAQYDCYGAMMRQGGSKWVHHRLWKMACGVRFAGRVHEYPILDGLKTQVIEEFVIEHDATPGTGEDSNARNLRILQSEFTDNPTTRGAFYIATTHRDGGRPAMAAVWFAKRIEMGMGYRDEWLFSHLYRARCLREAGDLDAADAAMAAAEKHEPTWAEFTMERAAIAYKRGRYAEAIEYAAKCINRDPPPTNLWRENPMYRDQPVRLISWCHEHIGNMASALHWAREANKYLTNDIEWEARIARLESLQPAPVTTCPHCGNDINEPVGQAPREPSAVIRKTRPIIALHRPGAIGDVLMTLNLIPALREANPHHSIFYFCHASIGADDALGRIIRAAGCDMVMDSAHWSEWSRQVERPINLVGYPLAEGYPEKPMRRHLLEYFANEMGLPVHLSDGAVAFGDIIPPDGVHVDLPALTLRRPQALLMPESGWGKDVPYITVQDRAGWSKYKEWPNSLWMAVSAMLPPGVGMVHIDAEQGRTLYESIALVANARMHVGIDSFCNHLTNYFWQDEHGGRRVPGVILWGSTQASAAGYPTNTNISKGLHCQPCFRENPGITVSPRGPCINPPRPTYDDATPHACMAGILRDEVIYAIRAMWARCAQ